MTQGFLGVLRVLAVKRVGGWPEEPNSRRAVGLYPIQTNIPVATEK
jgi:hypothetical protein